MRYPWWRWGSRYRVGKNGGRASCLIICPSCSQTEAWMLATHNLVSQPSRPQPAAKPTSCGHIGGTQKTLLFPCKGPGADEIAWTTSPAPSQAWAEIARERISYTGRQESKLLGPNPWCDPCASEWTSSLRLGFLPAKIGILKILSCREQWMLYVWQCLIPNRLHC